jgi:hypothetical protein
MGVRGGMLIEVMGRGGGEASCIYEVGFVEIMIINCGLVLFK